MIRQLETQPNPLELNIDGKEFKGEAIPVLHSCHEFDIVLNNESIGMIRYAKSGWKMHHVEDKKLVKEIGKALLAWSDQ